MRSTWRSRGKSSIPATSTATASSIRQLNFEAADTEGDGYIGFKEFVAWWTN
jgi:hypothetical protein